MRVSRLAEFAVTLSVCAAAFGQTSTKPAVPSDAQKAFDEMKTLVGT